MYGLEERKYLLKNKSVKIYRKILKGDLKRFPKNYWQTNQDKMDDAGMCIRYMVEYVLKWDKDKMRNMTMNTFRLHGLGNMLRVVFDNNVYDAVDCAYNNEFYPWSFKSCSKGLWNKELANIALREAVRRRGWTGDDIIKGVTYGFIRKSGLEYVMKEIYENDLFSYIDGAYEGQFKKWQLKRVNNGYWNDDTVKEAVLWMIDRLGWNREDIKKNLNKKVFKDMGLGGMLNSACNDSIYKAINIAMPGEFKRFEFPVPKGYWTKERCIEAIKFMIEEELKYSVEDVKSKLSREDFEKSGLIYPIRKEFNGDYYSALNEAYKGVYRKSELKNIRTREKRTNKVQEYMKYAIETY